MAAEGQTTCRGDVLKRELDVNDQVPLENMLCPQMKSQRVDGHRVCILKDLAEVK